MTGRAFVLMLIAASALYAARNVGVGWLYALGYSLAAGVLASAAFGAWALRGVRVTVAPSRTTEAGQPLPVAVTLENRGSRPRRYLSLLAPPLGTRARLWPWRRALVPAGWGTYLIPELKPGERLTVQLPVPAPLRGLHALPPLYLQAAPLGLVACYKRSLRHSRIPLRHSRAGGNPVAPVFTGVTGSEGRNDGVRGRSDAVMVHPRSHALGNLAWLDRGRGEGERDVSPRPEDGGELTKAVRPYRSGDAMRQIHWKTTARTGQLAVRESEGDAPGQELAVVLDPSPEHNAASFEIALELAASLLMEAQRRGFEARLYGGSSEARGPEAQSLKSQLDWLATLEVPEPSLALSPGVGIPAAARRVVAITARPWAWAGRAEACICVVPGATIEDVLKELS
ncbi:hypothetical protein D3C87_651210 [compost metagenome]